LAREIGALAAWRFHRDCVRAVVRRMGADRRWKATLALTPDCFVRRGRFGGKRIARTRQGLGDLGLRMARLFADLPPGPVIIIGSDIPGITRDHIETAFRALGRYEAAFGPAPDGGYWLVGFARRRLKGRAMLRIFAGVRWSSEYALADTRANLPRDLPVALLDTLEDVDDAGSWRRASAVSASG
jgi:hypothetical protein